MLFRTRTLFDIHNLNYQTHTRAISYREYCRSTSRHDGFLDAEAVTEAEEAAAVARGLFSCERALAESLVTPEVGTWHEAGQLRLRLLPDLERLPPVWVVSAHHMQHLAALKLEAQFAAGQVRVDKRVVVKVRTHVELWK